MLSLCYLRDPYILTTDFDTSQREFPPPSRRLETRTAEGLTSAQESAFTSKYLHSVGRVNVCYCTTDH